MQISRIDLRNFMAIKAYSLELGKLTLVTAPNAAGKTSIATAIETVLEGGAQKVGVVRNGESTAEVGFLLDDGISIEKSLTADSATIKIKNATGKIATSRPVEMLGELLSKASANPILFFNATKEERKKILLKAMPIKADPARLESITGQKVSATGNAWDVINALDKQIREERRITNTTADAKENSIQQLENALPVAPVHSIDINSITTKLLEIDAVKDAKFAAIDNKLGQVRASHKAAVEKLNQEHNSEVEAIRAQIRALEDQIREKQGVRAQEEAKLNAELADNENRAKAARTDRENEWKTARSEFDLQLKQAKEISEQEGRVKQSRDNIEAWKKEVVQLRAEAGIQTEQIEALDAYRLELMMALPVPGLEFRGDEIYYTDPAVPGDKAKPWNLINEAKRVELAVDIALLQCGKVPFLFIDGAERLDHANFELFKKKILSTNAQCLMFGVNHEPGATGFKVEVFG